MTLSVIIASRNDMWEAEPDGTNRPIDRLARTLASVLPNLTNGRECVVTDWGSEFPLAEAMPGDLANHPALRIARIPPHVAHSVTPGFSEPHALNHAARLCRGDWIARLDQDCIPGAAFWGWVNKHGPSAGSAYFSNRRDVERGQSVPRGDEPTTYPPDAPDFWRWHVGVLLVERDRWNAIRGYDERNVHRNHMEHEFIVRLSRRATIVNLGLSIGCPFFHQWHRRSGHEAAMQNRLLGIGELSALPEIANDAAWGMGERICESE